MSPSLYPVPLLLGSTKIFSIEPSSMLPTNVFAAVPTPSSDCGKFTITFYDIEYNEPLETSSDFIAPPIAASVCNIPVALDKSGPELPKSIPFDAL